MNFLPIKVVICLLTIGLFLLGASSCTSDKKLVRIAYQPILVSSPFFVAMEKGFFTNEGVTIEAQRFTTSNQSADALLSGRTDVIISLAQSITASIEAKQPGTMKVFMCNAQNDRDYLSAFLVKKGSAIKSVKDLSAKTIGCYPGQQMVVYTTLTLQKFGLEVGKNVQLVELDPSVQLQALESGTVDAIQTLEPAGTAAVEKGVAEMLLPGAFESSVINPWIGGAYVFSASFVAQHSADAERVKRALERAVDWMRQDPTEYKRILPKWLPVDENVAAKTTNVPYWKMSEIDKEAFQRQTDLLYDKGIIPTRVDTRRIFYSE